MIIKLIAKDWQLFKKYMLGYAILGMVAAGVMSIPVSIGYYTGVVVLITVMIAAGAHLVISSVITEKKEYQLSFIMGLPINTLDYALSKIIGGLFIYLTCWLPIIAAAILAIVLSDMPNGLTTLFLMGSLEILTATTLLLCIAVLSSSEAITIVSMVILNLLFNIFLFAVLKLPGVADNVENEVAIFNTSVIQVISLEILIIAFALITTGYIKSRKACFL